MSFWSSGGSFRRVPNFAYCYSPQQRPGKRSNRTQPETVFRRRSAARSVRIEKKGPLAWEFCDYCTSVTCSWHPPRSVGVLQRKVKRA